MAVRRSRNRLWLHRAAVMKAGSQITTRHCPTRPRSGAYSRAGPRGGGCACLLKSDERRRLVACPPAACTARCLEEFNAV